MRFFKKVFVLIFKKPPSFLEKNSFFPFNKFLNLIIARNIWNSGCKRIQGGELIYIHIPKCGGTSVAKAIETNEIDHKSAYTYYLSDHKRFASAVSFSVIRNPIDRFLSLMAYVRDGKVGMSPFVKELQALDATEIAFKYFDSPFFKKELLYQTHFFEAGFSLTQKHWVSDDKKILVNRIFSLESIHLAEDWLSTIFEKKIRIPHLNQSSNFKHGSAISADLERSIIQHYAEDWELWQKVTESGGQIVYR